MLESLDKLPPIFGQGVELRWIEHADAPDLFNIFSDAETMAYWSSLPMTELSQAQEMVENCHRLFAEHSLYEWGVCESGFGRVIGTFTLFKLDPENLRAELGFALLRSYWRRGLMREAVRAGIEFAFSTLGLERLEADVDPRNEGSLALLEGLGFEREGYMRERWRVGGGVQDSVNLGLLKREWAG